MSDFLFRGELSSVDPEVDHLIQFEADRQIKKLILIPSESTAPLSVRQSLGSVFQNLYAEGYPDEETRLMSEEEILDYPARLSHYRRYADPRYYKGVEYADVVEALARRRCAELFATEKISASQLYVNVQPLSGAPANNAVTRAAGTGDTILGITCCTAVISATVRRYRSGKLFRPSITLWFRHRTYRTTKWKRGLVSTNQNHHRRFFIYPWVPLERYRAIADAAVHFCCGYLHTPDWWRQKPSPLGWV